MTAIEIKLEIAKAAITAGINQSQAKDWFKWVTDNEVLDGGTDAPPMQNTLNNEAREKVIENIIYGTRMRWHDADTIVSLIEYDDKAYSLGDAVLIARLFIKAHAKDVLLEAIKDGTVKAAVPEKKEVAITKWHSNGSKELATRVQPVGKYIIQKYSLIHWLYCNYPYRVRDEWLEAQLTSIANIKL